MRFSYERDGRKVSGEVVQLSDSLGWRATCAGSVADGSTPEAAVASAAAARLRRLDELAEFCDSNVLNLDGAIEVCQWCGRLRGDWPGSCECDLWAPGPRSAPAAVVIEGRQGWR